MEKIDITYLNETCETLIQRKELPLGYFFVKKVKIKKDGFRYSSAQFYGTQQYIVGSFYKPTSFKPRHEKKIL